MSSNLPKNETYGSQGQNRAHSEDLNGTFSCLDCSGTLREAECRLICAQCGVDYPIHLGVPILVRGAWATPSPFSLSQDTFLSICKMYMIQPDEEAKVFLTEVLAHEHHFEDKSLDAENNYFLNRLGLGAASGRQILDENHHESGARFSYQIVRHHIPSELAAGTQTSHNVRLRNTGDKAWTSFSLGGHVLGSKWYTGTGTSLNSEAQQTPLPTALFPGREVTIPIYLTPPSEAGEYFLRIGFSSKDDGSELIDPLEIPVTVRIAPRRPYEEVQIGAGPKLSDYNEDHREAIRILADAVRKHGSQVGLELGGCSTPMTVHQPCQIVNVDIDIQTLQVGRFVSNRRGHHHVKFVCSDAHYLAFQHASFDFAAVFAALHHFSDPLTVLKNLARIVRPEGFIAVMCEPAGHYRDRPDPEMQSQMEFGINEQRFSLQEYQEMFHDAGLRLESAKLDADSLKAILTLRK